MVGDIFVVTAHVCMFPPERFEIIFPPWMDAQSVAPGTTVEDRPEIFF